MRNFLYFLIPREVSKKDKHFFLLARKATEKQVDLQIALLSVLLSPGVCLLAPDYQYLYEKLHESEWCARFSVSACVLL